MTSSQGRFPNIDNNLEQMIVSVLAVRSTDDEKVQIITISNTMYLCSRATKEGLPVRATEGAGVGQDGAQG